MVSRSNVKSEISLEVERGSLVFSCFAVGIFRSKSPEGMSLRPHLVPGILLFQSCFFQVTLLLRYSIHLQHLLSSSGWRFCCLTLLLDPPPQPSPSIRTMKRERNIFSLWFPPGWFLGTISALIFQSEANFLCILDQPEIRNMKHLDLYAHSPFQKSF